MFISLYFVLVLTVTINGQNTENYEYLQNEVEMLKTLVQSLITAQHNLQDQYDEVRQELKDVRQKYHFVAEQLSNKETEHIGYDVDDTEYKDLRDRSAAAIPSSGHWNMSTASAPSPQLTKGTKGEKGEPGNPGVRGYPGVEGMKGASGHSGAMGQKGESGTPGFPGPKGNTGAAGPMGPRGYTGWQGHTGPQGPPGAKGHSGFNGIPGPKGEPGLLGLPGQKGEPGYNTPVAKSSFYVTNHVNVQHSHQTITSANPISNVGGHYNQATGIFTCSTHGVYLFSWSLDVWHGQNVFSHLDVNGQSIGELRVEGTGSFNTGSRVTIVTLSRGQTVQLKLATLDHNNDHVITHFIGALLY